MTLEDIEDFVAVVVIDDAAVAAGSFREYARRHVVNVQVLHEKVSVY